MRFRIELEPPISLDGRMADWKTRRSLTMTHGSHALLPLCSVPPGFRWRCGAELVTSSRS